MSEKPENWSTGAPVMRNAPLRDELALVAGPRAWSDTRESWLARAARRCGINYRTAKAVFYGETTDPRTSVERKIREAAALAEAQQSRRADADKLLSMAAALEAKADEEFHSTHVEALRDLANRLINQD